MILFLYSLNTPGVLPAAPLQCVTNLPLHTTPTPHTLLAGSPTSYVDYPNSLLTVLLGLTLALCGLLSAQQSQWLVTFKNDKLYYFLSQLFHHPIRFQIKPKVLVMARCYVIWEDIRYMYSKWNSLSV